jgi:glutamate/tyrosine decarboxylase-like PLP-dependent enzyme
MDIDDLERRLKRDRPVMVVGTAGTTASGVIDPLHAIADICRKRNIWFHADAAWGGAAIVSPALRGHLAGIEWADSVTCDAHKWFSVPMGAGMFFTRHRDAVDRAFRIETPYMPARTPGADHPFETTAQWSRRFIGLKLFMTIAELGERGIAERIEHQARTGEYLRRRLRESGWTIVNDTPLPLVCFTRPKLDVARFLRELYRRQIAWMSSVRIAGGPPVVRACITSFRTTERDIDGVLRGIAAAKLQ